jgi:hypothetical protein
MSDFAEFLARGTFDAIFAAKTEEVGECVEWTGNYGRGSTSRVPILGARIGDRSVNLAIPRLAWMQAHGAIPRGRIVYRHRCCNDRCVSLDHLKLGKLGDQLRRRAELGMARHLQSTVVAITQAARRQAKYSVEQAAAVRELAAAGVPDILIAGATDVGLSSVGDIRLGRAWAERAPAASVFGWRPS